MSTAKSLSIFYIGEHYCALFGATNDELPSLAIIPNVHDVLVEARRYNDGVPWFYCLLGRSKDLNCEFNITVKHQLRHSYRDSATHCVQAELLGFGTSGELRVGGFVNVCNAANASYRSFARITAKHTISADNALMTRLTVKFARDL
jgi:hypothetical protein